MKAKPYEPLIENLIDQSSVADLLQSVSNVCLDKAQHIEENWQDPNLANKWQQAGDKIQAIALKLLAGDVPGISK